MAKVMERIKDLDLYTLLEITPDADEKTIKKAYRKKALKVHPDKNPDNKKAAEEFHTLSDAYEVLTDADTKKAYDNLLKARKANELRNRQLDAKRKKLKDDLEAREKAARDEHVQVVVAKKNEEERLLEEIERLRKEGSRRLEEEQERMRREIEEERKARSDKVKVEVKDTGAKLKVRWKESGEVVYDEVKLRNIFTKYGDVNNVVVLRGGKSKVSGLVEMASRSAAVMACKIETGFSHCPMKVKVVDENGKEVEDVGGTEMSWKPTVPKETLVSDNDFESLVMRKLRQEEERKKEIQRIMEEDAREEEAQMRTSNN